MVEVQGSSIADDILQSLPQIVCILFGLLLSLYPHGFAPRSETDKQLILGASRAPFFAGFVAASNLLWLVLSPSMAPKESIFFYHLTMLVFGLGGAVGGVTMVKHFFLFLSLIIFIKYILYKFLCKLFSYNVDDHSQYRSKNNHRSICGHCGCSFWSG